MIGVGIILIITFQFISFIGPTLEPHLRKLNVTPAGVSLILFLMNLMECLCPPIVCWISGLRINQLSIIAVGQLIFFVGFTLLGPTVFLPINPSVLLSTIAVVIIGIANAMAIVPSHECLVKIAM